MTAGDILYPTIFAKWLPYAQNTQIFDILHSLKTLFFTNDWIYERYCQ